MSQLFALVVSMCLIGDVSSVAITAQPEKVMRSEKNHASMEMYASGDMRSTQSKKEKITPAGMCRYDYPLGQINTCDCASSPGSLNHGSADDKAAHQLIQEELVCEHAAKEAGLSINRWSYVIPQGFYHHHPKGCFKDACTSDPSGQCYFFNPIGPLPHKCWNHDNPTETKRTLDGNQPAPGEAGGATFTGIPVCRRPHYTNGTANANGGCEGGSDYSVIMDEDNCTNAAECEDRCPGQTPSFLVTAKNQSRHNDFPLGCFLNVNAGADLDHCVYYNPPLEGWEAPTNPKGISICNVTTRSWIHSSGQAASGTGADTEDRSGNITRAKCETMTCMGGEVLIPAAATTPCCGDGVACNPCVVDAAAIAICCQAA